MTPCTCVPSSASGRAARPWSGLAASSGSCAFGPTVVVVWEYGPTALRAWAWCARRHIPLVLFSENTPSIAERLPSAQLRLHRWLAGRAKGFIAASSAARERFLALGAAPEAVEVSLQSFDPGPIRAAESRA